MRSIVNISLPKELVEELNAMVKKGKYSTKSEVVRDLIRSKIENDDLVRRVRKSQAEFRAGKALPFRSLDELDRL